MVGIVSRAQSKARLESYMRGEDGSFIVLGLFLFMGILLIGGVGVDIMRHDYERLRMQSTLDSAILAAADLDQHRDPEAVVRDFFDKAGMGDRLDDVSVVSDINSRIVSADASMDLQTMFMKSVGVETLANRATGMAREDIRDIEVSLVLDYSASMKYNGRNANLRKAAKTFVSTVLIDRSGDQRNDVSINLVPYNHQVAIGPEMLAQFNLTKTHGYSACIDLVGEDFNSLSLDPSSLRRQTAHFDPLTNSDRPNDRRINPLNLSCRVDPAFAISYLSNDIQALYDQIDTLTPSGNTSIDLGLKWGTALLDPSLRPALDNIRGAENPMAGRPFDYDRPNTMKVIVLMTDGENTMQPAMRDDYAGDLPSGVFRYMPPANAEPQFSVRQQENGDYDGDGVSAEAWYIPGTMTFASAPLGGSDARELSFAELWASGSVDWNARFLRSRGAVGDRGLSFWRNSILHLVGRDVKDRRVPPLCNLADDAGIVIFTVALDIPEAHAKRVRDCATTENHYFNVVGDEIVYAFGAIAGTINQLKLVQ